MALQQIVNKLGERILLHSVGTDAEKTIHILVTSDGYKNFSTSIPAAELIKFAKELEEEEK